MRLGFTLLNCVYTDASKRWRRGVSLKYNRWIRQAVLIALVEIACPGALAESLSIRLVVSDDNAFSRETANRLQILIEQSVPGIALERVTATAAASAAASPALVRLVVTVGDAAWQSTASSPKDSPILAVMPQSRAYETMIKRSPRNFAAIFVEQPVGRIFNLVSLLKPGDAEVGIVLGAATQDMAPLLQAAANERNQRLLLETASEGAAVGRVLADVIRGGANVLVAIPDPVVQTANTVQPILLMSYHAGIPVIGYSAAYQRAGAMVSLYSTPEQLARQVSEAVIAWTQGKGLSAIQEPKYFTVGINTTVARSLGIELPDADTLEQKLRSMKE